MVKTNTASLYPDRLQRWRRAAVMLSASRRFRYTLDLKKGEEKKRIKAKIRMHAQVIRAVYLFQVAGAQVNVSGNTKLPLTPTPTRDNDIQPEQLAPVTWDHHFSAVQHCGGVKGLVKNLKTNPEKRLPGDEVDLLQRKSVFGSNTYPREKGQSFWRFFLEACRDTTLIILMIVTAACLGLPIKTRAMVWTLLYRKASCEQGIDGGSIALAVVIVIVVTALSNYRQYLQFRSLNKEKQNIHLEVSGALASKPVRPQDVVTTEAAEIIVLEQTQKGGPFAVMQSTAAVNKTHCVFSHDQVTNIARDQDVTGSETEVAGQRIITEAIGGEVISVGINTEWRLLTTNIAKDNGEESLLQVRLHGIATLIGIFGLVVAFAALVVLLVRYFTGHTNHPNGSLQFAAGKTSVGDVIDGAMEIFTVAVIVVVAVPEGLSLAVSLIIAYSMRKMLADKALVRGLSACDAMGSVTIICDDKSRTLTLNLMTVVEAYVCGKKIDSPNNRSLLPPKVTSLLIEGIAQNTTGSVFIPEGGGDVIFSGSPTEKAVLQWGINLGMNFDAVRSDSSVICAFPFNSENMRGGVAVKLSDSEVHIHWKGAAEIVLALCTRYIDANGCLLPMDEDKVTLFKKAIDEMAAGGLRCVAIAYRSCEMENVPTDEEELVHWELPVDDLVLLAIVGLKDPCQPGVKDAVQSCISAGIKVCMVTGDDLQTARAIALECGILGSDADATEPNLIDGREFRALSDMQRQEIAEKISVLGSSSPSDELLLAQALRKRGHVVAVTRDGTNDAPALHEGDIGLAMGIEGEAVANDNSDIVIIDGNFSSIVKVVRWGRSVYANIQKFIQFQLTINVAALIINVVAAVSSGDAPLNAVQLLWVNFIMDTLGALALATEPPTNHLMHRPPAGRREPLITNIKWRNLVIQALYQVTVLLVLNFRGRSILNLEHKNNYDAINEKNTLLFNAFFLCQIFNVFNARKPDEINVFKGVTRNHLFMAIVGLTLVLQIFIIMFLGKLTSTVRLSWKSWLVSIIIGLISGPLAIIGKLIPVPETPLSELLTKKLHQWRTSRGSISRRHVAAWVMSI